MTTKVVVDDRAMKKLVKRLGTELDRKVRVGVLAEDKGAGRTEDGSMTMVELATIHEYGSPKANIPQRSFLRAPFETPELQRQQRDISAKLANKLIEKGMTVDQALNILGTWGVQAVKKYIQSGIEPANKPATVAKKGSDKPLVDTGRLINSVTHKVE